VFVLVASCNIPYLNKVRKKGAMLELLLGEKTSSYPKKTGFIYE
jgi:hypothetical protein